MPIIVQWWNQTTNELPQKNGRKRMSKVKSLFIVFFTLKIYFRWNRSVNENMKDESEYKSKRVLLKAAESHKKYQLKAHGSWLNAHGYGTTEECKKIITKIKIINISTD